MRTDCLTCPVRDQLCDDCMVPVLLAMDPPVFVDEDHGSDQLDRRESSALEMLVVLGLVDPRDAQDAQLDVGAALPSAM